MALSHLLSLEEGSDVDWDQVQDCSIKILASLRSSQEPPQFPAAVIVPYLTDFALRQQSTEEQHRQHGALIAYLRSF